MGTFAFVIGLIVLKIGKSFSWFLFHFRPGTIQVFIISANNSRNLVALLAFFEVKPASVAVGKIFLVVGFLTTRQQSRSELLKPKPEVVDPNRCTSKSPLRSKNGFFFLLFFFFFLP